jgi:hypothetical protein
MNHSTKEYLKAEAVVLPTKLKGDEKCSNGFHPLQLSKNVNPAQELFKRYLIKPNSALLS